MFKRLFIIWQTITPHHALSRLVGVLAYCRWIWLKNSLIKGFIKAYAINVAEAKSANLAHYEHFNAFFTRALKNDARPIDMGDTTVISPVDGAISAVGALNGDKILQAKGQKYTLTDLVANYEVAKKFANGEFATLYLAPKDYHRIHMPYSGQLQQMTFIPGRIFSVNPSTVENVPGLFAKNERVVAEFLTDKGPMLVIFVGAMLVASIKTQWAGTVAPSKQKAITTIDYQNKNIHYEKGDEIGQFLFGSTVILIFANQAIHWAEKMRPNQSLRMGVQIAS